jgi:Fe-Mn family superoxide dismutase
MDLPQHPEVTQTLLEPTLNRREFMKMALGAGLAMAPLGGLLSSVEAREAKKADKPSQAKKHPEFKGKASPQAPVPMVNATPKPLEAKDFSARFATIEGISPKQLADHYGLYKGYVTKINDIQDKLLNVPLNELGTTNATYHPFREIHVEQSYALNGVILHEYYFGNLGGPRTAPSDWLKEAVTLSFGSWDGYLTQLTAVGKSMRGWAMTGLNLMDGRLHNYGLDTHNMFVPMHVVPVLVLDVYEHAYMIDFGTNRGAYLDTFYRNLDWQVVEDRLKAALLHLGFTRG